MQCPTCAVENHLTSDRCTKCGALKRGLVGSFLQISRKHLDRYPDEFEFRYNHRRNPYLFRDTLTRLVKAEAIPYKHLTA